MAQTDTKKFVEIQDIKDNAVILKDGSLRGVLEVDAINFELKSQEEQTAIILRFQDFLNSLDFSIQISILSRKLDLKEYIKTIDEAAENQSNDLIRIQTVEYARFIRGLLELSNIMSKRFFVVVPFYLVEKAHDRGGIIKNIKEIAKPTETVRAMKTEEFDTYREQLEQRLDFVSGGLMNMELRSHQLNTQELANLFYQVFNPEAKETISV